MPKRIVTIVNRHHLSVFRARAFSLYDFEVSIARMLNGLVVPTSGRVTVDGLDTRTDGRDVRRRVGFCFTDPDAQIVMPTVAEDVAFGLRRRGLSKAETRIRVAEDRLRPV